MTDTKTAPDSTAVAPVISHWIDGHPVEVQQKTITERWPEPGRREGLSLVFAGN